MRARALPRARRRARNEYRLTEKGLELFPALLALLQWGDRWTADPSGPAGGADPSRLRPAADDDDGLRRRSRTPDRARRGGQARAGARKVA